MGDLSIEEALVVGSRGKLTTDPADVSKPLIIRGVVKRDKVNECKKVGRNFFYTDTGYVGNFPSPGNPSGKKIWHRVVKNENQHSTIREVPSDRWDALVKQDPNLRWTGWKTHNKKILLVMPNPKACKYYNVDYDTWVEQTKKEIAKYSDLPVEIRIKGSRSERNQGYTIHKAFDSGVYATVAMNSIAALESILYGIPAFVSVPCAASPLASNDLSQLSTPFKPDPDLILKQCHNIAYGQFTTDEILNGTAYELTEKYS
jgi:hypothetical protein